MYNLIKIFRLRRMKKLVWLTVIAFFASCSAKFDTFPGQEVHEFPESMEGTYIPVVKGEKSKSDEKIILQGDSIISVEKGEQRVATLGDSLRVSIYKDQYFYCIPTEIEGDTFWEVFPIVQKKNDLMFYSIDEEALKETMESKEVGEETVFILDIEALYQFCQTGLKEEDLVRLKRQK